MSGLSRSFGARLQEHRHARFQRPCNLSHSKRQDATVTARSASWIRTSDLRIMSPTLYPLSYCAPDPAGGRWGSIRPRGPLEPGTSHRTWGFLGMGSAKYVLCFFDQRVVWFRVLCPVFLTGLVLAVERIGGIAIDLRLHRGVIDILQYRITAVAPHRPCLLRYVHFTHLLSPCELLNITGLLMSR